MKSNVGNLNFINTTLRFLPLDPIHENYTRQVNACFSLVNPTPVLNPRLVHFSIGALRLLDLNWTPELVNYFSGNRLLLGSQPAAHCYCGHQFGSFAGQLGDGRAIYLGEIVNKITFLKKRYAKNLNHSNFWHTFFLKR